VVFIFSIGSFFTIVTGALLRLSTREDSPLRLLNFIGFLPAFCDVIENHIQMILVAVFPARYDPVVIVIATFTAIKWVTLLASIVIFFGALTAATFFGLRKMMSRL
jgi:multisubunit Na+/H+ antiporter MnhE subunit